MTDMELQRRYLYCVVVPGKSARFAVTAVDRLVPACPGRLGEWSEWSEWQDRFDRSQA